MSFHFVLKRKGWGYDDIYEAIKTGEKTSEWRDGSKYWISRLLTPPSPSVRYSGQETLQHAHEIGRPSFLMDFADYHWKHKKARFVVGYTKTPMLIADVKAIIYYSKKNQFEIRIENVKEVT